MSTAQRAHVNRYRRPLYTPVPPKKRKEEEERKKAAEAVHVFEKSVGGYRVATVVLTLTKTRSTTPTSSSDSDATSLMEEDDDGDDVRHAVGHSTRQPLQSRGRHS